MEIQQGHSPNEHPAPSSPSTPPPPLRAHAANGRMASCLQPTPCTPPPSRRPAHNPGAPAPLLPQPFTINAYTGETGEQLAEYQVGPFEVPAGAEKAKIKAKVRALPHRLL